MLQIDALVCGLGAAGTAVLHRLAAQGLRVVGIERFAPGHSRGSSHGATRIFRLGYFEHPSYVPLLLRAQQLWRELENDAGEPLLQQTGILEIGPPEGEVAGGSLAASRLHRLPHDVLDAAGLRRRFPQFTPRPDDIGVFQPGGGFLWAERALRVQLAMAKAAGAQARYDEEVLAIDPGPDGVSVRTTHATFEAAHVVVTAGPWLGTLMPALDLPLRVTRQAVGWFAPRAPEAFSPDRFPVFILESASGVHYGFPLTGEGGMKIAKHHHESEIADPAADVRAITEADEALIRAPLKTALPDADGPMLAAQTCLYTMTPDGHFILDRMPGCARVIVASACSGHGFKFAPLIGEIVADMVTRGASRYDVSRFGIGRFAPVSAPEDDGPPPIAQRPPSQ